MIRELGPVTLELRAVPHGFDLVVSHEDLGGEWVGVASFPREMEDEALYWMQKIGSENDLEDLLRQWSPAETWDSFQLLRNAVGA